MKITRTGAVIALSMALMLSASTLATPTFAFYTEIGEVPVMANPVTPDTTGVLELENDDLLDFIIPDTIAGTTVDTIGAYAFEGCDLIRTVTIPASVTEIGDGAFADCPYLQAILLKDRADTTGMILGADWSGQAEVICFPATSESYGPSAEQLAFDQVLQAAAAIDSVDETNLSCVQETLTNLQEAYDALPEAERTNEVTARYHAAQRTLTQQIKTMESVLIQSEVQEVTPVAPTLSDESLSPSVKDQDSSPLLPEEPSADFPETDVSLEDPFDTEDSINLPVDDSMVGESNSPEKVTEEDLTVSIADAENVWDVSQPAALDESPQ